MTNVGLACVNDDAAANAMRAPGISQKMSEEKNAYEPCGLPRAQLCLHTVALLESNLRSSSIDDVLLSHCPLPFAWLGAPGGAQSQMTLCAVSLATAVSRAPAQPAPGRA